MELDHRSVGQRIERLLEAVRSGNARTAKTFRRRSQRVVTPDNHHEAEVANPMVDVNFPPQPS